MTADDAGQVIVTGERQRRSIYVQVKRSQPMALLAAFDAPVMEVNCERRPSSTVAPQSLLLMNGEFILQQARKFAERVRGEAREASGDGVVAFDTSRLEATGAAWQYGYGMVDDAGAEVVWLGALPHWTGSAWQGGAKLPDGTLGWATLNSSGGHPAREYAVMRRWKSPATGVVRTSGTLGHGSDQGNGVRARMVVRRAGGEAEVIAEWVAEHGKVETVAESVEVAAGDVLDLVVDCRGDVGFDSFSWPVTVTLETAAGERLASTSAEEFAGPTWEAETAVAQVAAAWRRAYGREATEAELEEALEFLAGQVAYLREGGAEAARQDPLATAMTNLCQVLLSSNEFLYVE